MSLRDEIKQKRPFASLEQEAMLNLERTTAVLSHEFAEIVKPFAITPTQFNALRILRGAGAEGLCRNEIRDRLVSQVPDVTRLLDRLEVQGFVSRARGTDDRRLVRTRITKKGQQLLARLDRAVVEMHGRQLGHLGQQKLRTLVALLTEARGG